jgi:capsular polysaccharide export protein
MSYKILFFSVNRHQETYFEKLLGAIKKGDKGVSLHKRKLTLRPPALSIRKSDILLAKEVSYMRMAYFYNKTGRIDTSIRYFTRLISHIITTLFFLLRVKRFIQTESFDLVILWNDMKWHQYVIKKIAKEVNIKTVFFENGTLPNTVTFDPKGVNFNNSVPRNKQFYIDRIPELTTSFENESSADLQQGYIFIPFQVDYDSQIISHSPWLKNMEELFFTIEKQLPSLPEGLKVVIKEHPKSSRCYKHLHNKNPRIIFKNSDDTDDLVKNSKMVITINSTVGLESILKDKPVLVLGNAFYSIDGLCQSVVREEELCQAILSVTSPDQIIKSSFYEYLKEYYVEGNWHNPTLQHIKLIEEKVYRHLEKA